MSNLFRNQEVLVLVNLSPQEAIDTYGGVRSGSVKADFYDDCVSIPDPADLNVNENESSYSRRLFSRSTEPSGSVFHSCGRHNNCDTFYIFQNYFRLPRQTIRENANFIVLFSQDTKNLMHIHPDHYDDDMSLNEFKAFCRGMEQW